MLQWKVVPFDDSRNNVTGQFILTHEEIEEGRTEFRYLMHSVFRFDQRRDHTKAIVDRRILKLNNCRIACRKDTDERSIIMKPN